MKLLLCLSKKLKDVTIQRNLSQNLTMLNQPKSASAGTWFFSKNTTSLRRPHSLHKSGTLMAPHNGIQTTAWPSHANTSAPVRFAAFWHPL